jgi:predicted esterase
MPVRIQAIGQILNQFKVRTGLTVLLTFLFVGALFWAKGRDPFERIWFTVKTSDYGKTKCIAVLPKTAARSLPAVVYLHGSGGSLLGSGNELRQMAEMGLAAVGIEYNQTNEVAFQAQFTALQHYLRRQKWMDTNAMAWVGFSLGAQRQLSFLLKHPELQPKLLVRLAGGWVSEFESVKGSPSPRPSPPGEGDALSIEHPTSNIQHPTSNAAKPSTLNLQLSTVLILHSDQDSVFPAADAARVADALHTNGVSVDTKTLRGQSHGLDSNREVVFRVIGEYCLTHLKGPDALRNYRSIALWQSQAKPLWVYWVPAFVWVAVGCFLKWRNGSVGILAGEFLRREAKLAGKDAGATSNDRKLTRWEIGLRWLAGILAILAVGQTALHLIPPRLAISARTLAIAREHLIQPKEKEDFAFLASAGIWRGKRLKTLLTHVELANYNRELVNWKLDDQIYREFVLSSQVDSAFDGDMNWRRPLWESFYPRIRKETTPEGAAEIVVRHLRERVTIAEGLDSPRTIADVWLRQITTARGFEAIYVAALRSAGIPSRLDAQGRAEFWTGAEWKLAPRPIIESFR